MTYRAWLAEYQLCINSTFENSGLYWLTYSAGNVKLYAWHDYDADAGIEGVLARLATIVRGDSIKPSLERELLALAIGDHKVDALLRIGGGK